MKTFISYILVFFGVFFTQSGHGLTLQSKYVTVDSFEKAKQKFSITSPDLKKSFFFSEEDIFNDDDDENISVKKKITFAAITSFGADQFIFKPSHHHIRSTPCYEDFSKLHLFEFITLNALKI